MGTHTERFCGRCGQPSQDCADRCAQQHRFDPDRFCTVCGHRLDVQVYPDHVESACKVCRVRAARGTAAP
ncbi:MAG TPA: hypothetical protein VMM13_10485 [Euzebya sp.]|nr:hypothetical protein [Euzebya sp.]